MNGASLRYLDEHLIREKEYWLEKLSGDLIITGIPLDHSRPAAWRNGKAVIDIKIDSDNQSRLQNVCGGKDPLIFTVLVAALKIVLHKYTGSEDIIVGTTVQRGYKELASLNHVLALRDRVSGSLKIRDLLENVRQTISESYANQKYSFKRLLELLNIELPSNRAPLFSVMVVIDSIHARENVRDLKQDLTLSFSSNGGGLSGVVEFSPTLFRRDTIEVFVEHYKRALHTVLSRPDIAISEIELLSPGRKHERIFGFNNTESDYPKDKTIHQLFQDLAARTPGEVAVALGASQLTYYELNSRANQLAHYLRKLGITRGKFVGLFVDHSIEMIVGMLGTLKAGGAYLPLDSSHPRARLAFMIEDAQISLVLTQQRLVDRLPPHAGDTLCLESDWELVARESEQNPECDAAADDLAYLIYTSGSTGRPKGVKIQHRSLVNYAWWAKDVYVRGERVTFPLYSSLAFDLTVTSIFTPLITGNRIVIYHWEGREVGLEEIIKDERIDIIKLTPSHLSLIKDKDNRRSRIKRLIVGGEALETGLARQAMESFGEGVEIFNEYGPTEATVGCMIHKFDHLKDDRAYVPIGRPAANVQIYVLDEDLQPVAENVFGELYISGEGLAEGYLNREDLTLERFIKNPFLTGRRMYKTGDLARWLPGDVLEYVGRTDDQVKFHGYRVEMNEIRCALNRHPQVRDSVVVLTKDPYGHDVMLAYYVSRRELAAAELRSFMAESIIKETLPNNFVHLTKLPLTLNGKINYGALPDLNAARSRIKREYEAASTATEKLVAGIWSQVLRIEPVGIHDNFFELGGHSMLAIQIRSRLAQKLGIEVPMDDLFKYPILADFARAIEGYARAELAPITQVDRNGRLELSFAQQRLWFLSQFEGVSEAYHIAGGLRLLGALDRDALRRALNRIVARHEVLRTTFSEVDGRPVQNIGPAETGFLLREHDLRSAPDRSAALERLAADEAGQPFDLEHGPLIRGRLAHLDQDDHALLVTMHHIVSDGWSMEILIKELNALYRAYCEGGEASLPDLPIQYADYAAWQRRWLQGAVLEAQLAYWKRQLGGELPVLALPTDKNRPAQQTHRGAEVSLLLPATLLDQLEALSLKSNCTLFMTLLSAFDILIYYLTGQTDICVGTDIANRNRAEIEKIIGFFVNQLVLRAELSPDSTFEELLEKVRETTLGAYANQDLPFEKLVEALNLKRDSNRHPLFQVKIVYQNTRAEEPSLTGLRISSIKLKTGAAKLDLLLDLSDVEQGLKATLQYNTALFEERASQRIISRFHTLLDRIVERPGAMLRELVEALIAEDERQQFERRDELENARLKKLTRVRRRAAIKPNTKTKS